MSPAVSSAQEWQYYILPKTASRQELWDLCLVSLSLPGTNHVTALDLQGGKEDSGCRVWVLRQRFVVGATCSILKMGLPLSSALLSAW